MQNARSCNRISIRSEVEVGCQKDNLVEKEHHPLTKATTPDKDK